MAQEVLLTALLVVVTIAFSYGVAALVRKSIHAGHQDNKDGSTRYRARGKSA